MCVRARLCVHTHTQSQTPTWRPYSPQFVTIYRSWRPIEILTNGEFLFTDFDGHDVRGALRRGLTVYTYIFWRRRQMFELTKGLMTGHYNTENDNFVTVYSLISLNVHTYCRLFTAQERQGRQPRGVLCVFVTGVCTVRCFNVRWMWALNILRIGCFACQCHLGHILFRLECVL